MTAFFNDIDQSVSPQGIGVMGCVIYVTAFAAMQLGWLDGNSTAHTLLIILAVSLVGADLFAKSNLFATLIQFSWITAGLAVLAQPTGKSGPAARQLLDTTLRNGTA